MSFIRGRVLEVIMEVEEGILVKATYEGFMQAFSQGGFIYLFENKKLEEIQPGFVWIISSFSNTKGKMVFRSKRSKEIADEFGKNLRNLV